MKKYILIIGLLLILLLLCCNNVSAIPTIKEYYNVNDDFQSSITLATWFAQSFTVGNIGLNQAYHLTGVRLKVFRTLNPTNITIHLRNVISGVIQSTDIVSDYFNPSIISTSATWTYFNFTLKPKLSNNYVYAIIINVTGPALNYISWRTDITTPVYSGGSLYRSLNSGSTWTILSTIDSMFECYGYKVNLSSTPILPSNNSNFNFQFVSMSNTNVFNITALYNKSDSFTVKPSWFFEDEEIWDVGVIFGSNITYTLNLFNWVDGWSGTLEDGITYTWRINLSAMSYNVWINNSYSFTFHDFSMLPLPLGYNSHWNLVSLPKNEEINRSKVFIRNATNNYTWNQAATNGIILNFTYGWYNEQYSLNTTFKAYYGYWVYFYDTSYEMWINTTCSSNASGGNISSFHIFLNLSGVIGFINWTGDINSTLTNVSFNVSSNMSIQGNANANNSDSFLYYASFDVSQSFLLISIFFGLLYFWWKSERLPMMYMLAMLIVPYDFVVIIVYALPLYVTDVDILLFVRIIFMLISLVVMGFTIDAWDKSRKAKKEVQAS